MRIGVIGSCVLQAVKVPKKQIMPIKIFSSGQMEHRVVDGNTEFNIDLQHLCGGKMLLPSSGAQLKFDRNSFLFGPLK